MSRDAWLSLHILGVVLFLGNIIVTSSGRYSPTGRRVPVVAYAQRLVTTTDIAFTATGVVLIVVSWQVMAEDFGGPAWLTIGWSLFIASGVIWGAALIQIEVMQWRGWRSDLRPRPSSRRGTGGSRRSGSSSAQSRRCCHWQTFTSWSSSQIERGVELVRYRREGRSAEVPVELLVASRALGK